LNTHRIVFTLQRVAAVFFGAGVLFFLGAIFWPGSVDSLVNASAVAAFGFAFPAGLAFVLAYWLDTLDRKRHGEENAESSIREP
jgi:hypothetical protein